MPLPFFDGRRRPPHHHAGDGSLSPVRLPTLPSGGADAAAAGDADGRVAATRPRLIDSPALGVGVGLVSGVLGGALNESGPPAPLAAEEAAPAETAAPPRGEPP